MRGRIERDVGRDWFSAMLRFVVFADEDPIHLARSLVLVRATDFTEAHRRAVEVGSAMEKSYVGGTGERIVWRLQAVETVDLLGHDMVDGREVYAEAIDPPTGGVPRLGSLDPEVTEPTQSGV